MEKGEKMLHLNVYFKLPADFKGDINDAIEAMLKYRRGVKNHEKNFTIDSEKSLYENWWDMISSTDRVLLGQVSFSEYTDDVTTPWQDLDLENEED